MENTKVFVPLNAENKVKVVLKEVISALKEKGYDPKMQLSGYILSGDPTYITSYKDARKMIVKIDTDEIVENLIGVFMEHIEEEGGVSDDSIPFNM